MRHVSPRPFVRRFAATLLLFALVFAASTSFASSSKHKNSSKSVKTKAAEGPVLTALRPGARLPGGSAGDGINPGTANGKTRHVDGKRRPVEGRMKRGRAFNGDLRTLPQTSPQVMERPELEEPEPSPAAVPGTTIDTESEAPVGGGISGLSAPAPSTSQNFAGLDFATFGAGHPPDTNGDVGPNHYIQTINTSIGIFDKTGTRMAAFTFNTLMNQGALGNLCDTANFGDPIVLYDTFEDRWVITDFAFPLVAGNPVAPAYECFAVSKTGDPVAGGWNFFSFEITGAFGDYPKLGVWPDGIYMSVNLFGFGGGSFQNPRVYAFNKAQMYSGSPTVQAVSFDAPAADFTILPSNARLQTGTPPPGTPNYFLSTWEFLNGLTVYKFHVDWDKISLSTFTGPDVPISPTSWPNAAVPNVPSQGGNSLDALQIRAMMQNQYTNLGGVESLWDTHTVRRGNTAGFAAPRWYQLNVTGGTVASTVTQAATWDPDGANVIHRWMPSLAVNHNGDMALGYSTSSTTTKPAIKYAGRLAADPINTFSQTEQLLIQGTGTQVGNCGTSACTRWGDYSAMTLDPDGCTFWFTTQYYVTDGLNHQTRIGAFQFPGCTTIGNGTLQGAVTASGSGNPIGGATVSLGSRTITTAADGSYSFSLPAGTYPSETASFAGFSSASASSIVVSDGATTTQNFVLSVAAATGCITDTTQADFQSGVATRCDLNGSPGNVILLNAATIDQQNTVVTNSGFGMNATNWAGQTFTPAVNGTVTRVDLDLFCSGCTGTTPNLAVSIRATSGGAPIGPDLATATIPGFSTGSGGYFTANFATPTSVVAGTRYAVIVHPIANTSAGIYAYVCSCAGTGTVNSNPYANGQRVTSASSGADGLWALDTTVGGRDLGFKVFVQSGFPSSGTFVSSTKDANPAPAATPSWSNISWTASIPTGTSLQFQAAGSNNPGGPFNFVGPDGTAGTFFSNGDSLNQFNGDRYLKYKAVFGSSDPAATPVLNDVSVCFNNVPAATALAVDPASGTFGGTADLAATLTSSGAGVSGRTISFTLNGTSVGSGTTDAAGHTSLLGASLAGIGGGTYPTGVAASFSGDASYATASASNVLTVNAAAQSITFGSLANKTFGDPDFTVSATASSGLPVSFSTTSTACSVSGNSVHIVSGGSCTITASQIGDANYQPAADVPQTFTIGQAGQTITFNPLAAKTIGDATFNVSATASSGLPVGFSAAGNCTISGVTVHLTGVGSCSITASQPGDVNYLPAPNVVRSFTIAYASCLLFDNTKATTLGSAVPVKLKLCSSTGANLSSPGVVVTGISLTKVGTGTVRPVQDAGNSNPGNIFRYDVTLAPGGGYILNLKTTALSSGTWLLSFTASGDSTTHTLTVPIK